jgi:excisionase family DNA binding protein
VINPNVIHKSILKLPCRLIRSFMAAHSTSDSEAILGQMDLAGDVVAPLPGSVEQRARGRVGSESAGLLDALLDELAERVSARLAETLKQATPSSPATPALMNTATACKWLGFSESKLRKLTRENLIPHRKLGAHVMFSIADLETYVAEHEHARSPRTARSLARQARGTTL